MNNCKIDLQFLWNWFLMVFTLKNMKNHYKFITNCQKSLNLGYFMRKIIIHYGHQKIIANNEKSLHLATLHGDELFPYSSPFLSYPFRLIISPPTFLLHPSTRYFPFHYLFPNSFTVFTRHGLMSGQRQWHTPIKR